jgi:predicted DNA-binding transcriptional regulator AlpA
MTEKTMLTTKEVATLTGLSTSYFEHQRWLGDETSATFLKYHKFGRAVRYNRADVRDWQERQRVG